MIPCAQFDILVMPIPNHLIEEYLCQGWEIELLPWPHRQYTMHANMRVPRKPVRKG